MRYEIIGNEYKTLEVTLGSCEVFYAERRSIVYVDTMIQREVELNASSSGVAGKLGGIVKTALSGESLLIIRFFNPTNEDRKIVLSGTCCSLFSVELQGQSLICHKGLYVASAHKLQMDLNITFTGLLGGYFQKMTGSTTVFLDSFGTPIVKQLASGEMIEADENHVVALCGFYDHLIQKGRSIGNILQGEGLSVMRLIGPGTVYLSPMPIPVIR